MPQKRIIRKKICLNCKKEFICPLRYGISKWKARKFCSIRCGALYYSPQRIKRMTGKNNPSWKKGNYIASSIGYKFLTISSLSLKDQQLAKQMVTKGKINKNRILEHRFIMAKKIGRPLNSSEIVHHIDGNKLNNHPDNLQLLIFDNRNCRYPIICPKCGYQF